MGAIQSSILSMMSSTMQGIAIPKAIKAMNKEEPKAEEPEAPTSIQSPGMLGTNTAPNITSYDMATPFERVRMEQARKQQQKAFMEKVKAEFGKADFSKVNLYPGGNN